MNKKFRIISILYALLVCIILYYFDFFFLLDFDTATQIIKMYHNEIWTNYPHHQLIIPYYKLFFELLSFIENDYSKFITIFLIHYFFGLIVLWYIIEFFSQNHWISFLFYISISISGIVLHNILTWEDGIITFPYYLLSFYLFVLFYDTKKRKFLILSAILSAFSVSINSSDFFLVVSITSFFGTLFIFDLIKNKNLNNPNIFYLLIYLASFFSILLVLLSIKSYISKESLIDLIHYTFISPHIMYNEFLGEFGITLPRIIKTINLFSFILIQDTRFFIN